MQNIILTNMILIYHDDQALVLDRKKNDWPGITFPGGKVDKDEDIINSVIREAKEETGLNIYNPICIGYIEWNIDDNRHLCLLFKTDEYDGELISSKEGEVFFVKIKNIKDYNLSSDMDKILDLYQLNWR